MAGGLGRPPRRGNCTKAVQSETVKARDHRSSGKKQQSAWSDRADMTARFSCWVGAESSSSMARVSFRKTWSSGSTWARTTYPAQKVSLVSGPYCDGLHPQHMRSVHAQHSTRLVYSSPRSRHTRPKPAHGRLAQHAHKRRYILRLARTLQLL